VRRAVGAGCCAGVPAVRLHAPEMCETEPSERCGPLSAGCIRVRSADGAWADAYTDTDIEQVVGDDPGAPQRLKRGRDLAKSDLLFSEEHFERFDVGSASRTSSAIDVNGGPNTPREQFQSLKLQCICHGTDGRSYKVSVRIAAPPRPLLCRVECSCPFSTSHHNGGVLEGEDCHSSPYLCKHVIGLLERARRASSRPSANATAQAITTGYNSESLVEVAAPSASLPSMNIASGPASPGSTATPANAGQTVANPSRGKRRLPTSFQASEGHRSRSRATDSKMPGVFESDAASRDRRSSEKIRPSHASKSGPEFSQAVNATHRGSATPSSNDTKGKIDPHHQTVIVIPTRPVTCEILVEIAKRTLTITAKASSNPRRSRVDAPLGASEPLVMSAPNASDGHGSASVQHAPSERRVIAPIRPNEPGVPVLVEGHRGLTGVNEITSIPADFAATPAEVPTPSPPMASPLDSGLPRVSLSSLGWSCPSACMATSATMSNTTHYAWSAGAPAAAQHETFSSPSSHRTGTMDPMEMFFNM